MIAEAKLFSVNSAIAFTSLRPAESPSAHIFADGSAFFCVHVSLAPLCTSRMRNKARVVNFISVLLSRFQSHDLGTLHRSAVCQIARSLFRIHVTLYRLR